MEFRNILTTVCLPALIVAVFPVLVILLVRAIFGLIAVRRMLLEEERVIIYGCSMFDAEISAIQRCDFDEYKRLRDIREKVMSSESSKRKW